MDATCDELVVNKNHSHYEKSNVIERCPGGHRFDVRFVLEHAGDVHDHNASNHCHVGASAFDGKNAYASPLWSARDRGVALSARQLFTAESPIQARQTQSAFHPRAQRNAFRRRGAHQQRRLFAPENPRLKRSPNIGAETSS